MLKNSPINYWHDESFHNEKAALEILPYVFNLLTINSIIDIGCGTGSWLSAAKKLNINEVKGVDGIEVKQPLMKLESNEFLKHDLRIPLNLNKKFDLCICLEVVEHLPIDCADTIIETITNHSDFILFSAAIPTQTGDHHFNEQWPSYWQEKFKSRGYFPLDILRLKFWNNEQVDWWYRQNILLYTNDENLNKKFSSPETVLPLVHPELLKLKNQVISYQDNIIQDQVYNPRILSALKKVYQSIFNAKK